MNDPNWYTYGIPRDWHQTEDPDLYGKYRRALLIRKFGDTQKVHTFVDIEVKLRKRIKPTQDEWIGYLEAMHDLWPNPHTMELIKTERARRARGEDFFFYFTDDTDGTLIRQMMVDGRSQAEAEASVKRLRAWEDQENDD